jgi:hypothetical protein
VECQAIGQIEAEGYKDMTVVGVERRDTIDVDICLRTVLEAPVMQYQMISFGYFRQDLVVSKILSICQHSSPRGYIQSLKYIFDKYCWI